MNKINLKIKNFNYKAFRSKHKTFIMKFIKFLTDMRYTFILFLIKKTVNCELIKLNDNNVLPKKTVIF